MLLNCSSLVANDVGFSSVLEEIGYFSKEVTYTSRYLNSNCFVNYWIKFKLR